nr:MAG TPA: hypothetical protein [Caudoviricetes sp.]
MKAHIPAAKLLPRAAKQAIREYDEELQAETFRRWVKLTVAVLHNEFKFGHDRCATFLGKISELSGTEKKDEIFWSHIDQVVIDEIGLDFEQENYSEVER